MCGRMLFDHFIDDTSTTITNNKGGQKKSSQRNDSNDNDEEYEIDNDLTDIEFNAEDQTNRDITLNTTVSNGSGSNSSTASSLRGETIARTKKRKRRTINKNRENDISHSVGHHIYHHHHHYHHYQRPGINNTASSSCNNSISPNNNISPNNSISPNNTKHHYTSLSLRELSLQNLNALQHFSLSICRDIAFIPPILGLFNSLKRAMELNINKSISSHNSGNMGVLFYNYLLQNVTNNPSPIAHHNHAFSGHSFNDTVHMKDDIDINPIINMFQNFWKQYQSEHQYQQQISFMDFNATFNMMKFFLTNNYQTLVNGENNNNINDSSTSFSSISNIVSLLLNTINNTSNATDINSSSINNNNNNNNNKTNGNLHENYLSAIITARSSEYLVCAMWCLVSLYLTYVILDSLMVRWITKYSIPAAILRMFSISLMLITVELLCLSSLSPAKDDYSLHTWIFISCMLTVGYIWQSFWTSYLKYQQPKQLGNNNKTGTKSQNNKFLKYTWKRHLDLYNIIVFAVIPIGMASFITMIILLRNLIIQRLDVEQLERIYGQLYN